MDRDEAAATLALLQKVVTQARDDTALQNWGLIWMCSGVSNGAGFVATHWLLAHGRRDPAPFVVVWGVVFALNGLWIATMKGRSAGPPSFIERQIWSIWNTFIAGMALVAVVNWVLGIATMLFMPPVACVLAAMTFSIMGAMMGKLWYAAAALWAAMALALAALPGVQFALFGALWFATQFTAGALLHRQRRRQLREAGA